MNHPRTLSLTLVVAGALALASPAGADPPKGKYLGETSDAPPENVVKFKVRGKKIKGFSIDYTAPCNDGRALSGTFVFNTFTRNGLKFAIKGPSRGRLADGTPTSSNLKLKGKFFNFNFKAKGTFSITTELPSESGDSIVTCRSGKVTYIAAKSF